MARKEIIQKMKKMMPDGGKKGDILEVSVESPEHEEMEHAPGGPEEGMEDQELSVELMGKGKGKYLSSKQQPEEDELAEGQEHEAAESPEFEAGEAEESEEEEPLDLSSISDEELQAELDYRKKMAQEAQAKKPMAKSGTPGPKGGY